jgi:hypothetical protein
MSNPTDIPPALAQVLLEIYERTEASADGAPDASSHDLLANWVSGKLAQFIPLDQR